jgi:hypothetical protein
MERHEPPRVSCRSGIASRPVDERLEANRVNWDDRTGIHLDSAFYDVDGWLRDERGPRTYELEALGDVSGLRLLHLQCHFGLDTLAWARAGARVTGLDFPLLRSTLLVISRPVPVSRTTPSSSAPMSTTPSTR